MYLDVKDSQNEKHILAVQEKPDSCAIACAGMVIARIKSQKFDEKLLRQYSQEFDQGNFNPMPTKGWRKTKSGGGTDLEAIAIMLRKCNIKAETIKTNDVLAAFKKALPKSPIIGHIEWDAGGAHVAVIDGVYDGVRAIVCDPWHEYRLREINNLPLYNPGGRAPGKFSGWMITTA